MILLAALCAAPLARAQPAQQAPPPDAAPPGFWERDTLTGNWGGLRDRLVKDGVTITLTDTGELLSNVSGGPAAARARTRPGRRRVVAAAAAIPC